MGLDYYGSKPFALTELQTGTLFVSKLFSTGAVASKIHFVMSSSTSQTVLAFAFVFWVFFATI